MNTNFNLGDKENPRNTFMTIYNKQLEGRPCKSPAKNQKNKFLNSVKISNNENNDFISEKQLRYI
jgi:hypothetical protein